MPTKSFQRTDRVAEQLHMEIAKLIQQEVQDPRVKMVTITSVDVTRDLEHAKIYFAVHDEENQAEKTLEGLKKASGFLRVRLGQEMKLRLVPHLHFHYDKTLTNAKHIDELLRNIE
jgi:ribosome-binding factor A